MKGQIRYAPSVVVCSSHVSTLEFSRIKRHIFINRANTVNPSLPLLFTVLPCLTYVTLPQETPMLKTETFKGLVTSAVTQIQFVSSDSLLKKKERKKEIMVFCLCIFQSRCGGCIKKYILYLAMAIIRGILEDIWNI